MITIKTIPSKYFFSGDINLSGGKESQVDLDTLTKTQLLDIIEAEITRVLIVSDIGAVKEKYREILEGKPFVPAAGETSASVKEKYESNPNTNAFTDSLRSKLESLPTEGAKGEKGADGLQGQSTYELAVSLGYIGSEEEWLNSLKGGEG